MVGHAKLSTTCAFLFFWKAKPFKINYLCELPFRIALWIIYTRSIFSLVIFKIFWNFWNNSRNKYTQRQPFSGVYKIDVLKETANFTKKHQCWSHFLEKSPEIKRLRNKDTQKAQLFSCEFCEAFKNTFFTEHLRWIWSLSFKKFST